MAIIELMTSGEIYSSISSVIEQERIRQNLRQCDIAKRSGIGLRTYQNFIAGGDITVTKLVKIMYALRMFDNLRGLIMEHEYESLDDIRRKYKKVVQRVRLPR